MVGLREGGPREEGGRGGAPLALRRPWGQGPFPHTVRTGPADGVPVEGCGPSSPAGARATESAARVPRDVLSEGHHIVTNVVLRLGRVASRELRPAGVALHRGAT